MGKFVLALTALATLSANAQSPEDAARQFMRAVYSNDAAAFHKVTLPAANADRLLGKKVLSFEQLNAVTQEAKSMTFEVVQDFTFRAVPSHAKETGEHPVGTMIRYETGFRGTPLVVRVVRTADGWKVDPRWWLAMAEQGPEPEPKPGTPDFAIKAFLTTLVTNERDDARQFLIAGSDVNAVFAGAPAEPDHSDQVVALAIEMPLVEIPRHEFYALPSGKIVEGSKSPSTEKLMVGLYGTIEIPFVVRKIAEEWRVVPEPYFKALNKSK